MTKSLLVTLAALALGGCSTVGSLGIVSKSSLDSAAMLREGRPFKEVGPASGKACRYFLLSVLPWGDADIQTATDRALAGAGGGDALINVTTQNSLYGFLPIYSVFSYTCTEVKGTAIKFEQPEPPKKPRAKG
jgi:hypothetical protein